MSTGLFGDIASRVVHWQAVHGRNHLPWQQTRDPYRVWLSEIMLQQTQVSTVLDYYARFLTRFPDVNALAEASQDDVLGLWSGLGYYSRARNLHRCAQQIVLEHGAKFPQTAQVLATLPGIGRSTAGAIAAFCFAQRVAILDANVKRVITRLQGFDSDLASAKNERALWLLAEALLPEVDVESVMPGYTQGMMDLGAMVCTPRKPSCSQCPLQLECVAHQRGDPERYPVKTRKLSRRTESWWMLILRSEDTNIWLHKRPPTGIWAGLQCVPVFPDRASLMDYVQKVGAVIESTMNEAGSFLHVLTHRDLHLHPVFVDVTSSAVPDSEGRWYSPGEWQMCGLPAPVRKILNG